MRPRPRPLGAALEKLYCRVTRATAADDPVHLVRRYADTADREVVAFCAASLAFGRVAGILRSMDRLLAVMAPAPAAFVRRFDPARDGAALDPIVHRWTRGRDLAALMLALRAMLESSQTIERFFLAGHRPGAPDVGGALESFSTRALAADFRPAYGGAPPDSGVRLFFPRPSGGSACKRLNLFLRWMVRCDDIDPGGWTGISRAQLIVPLDTHVVRVSRCLGLTGRATPGWKMAAEITGALRVIDPADPVRFDFSLCHFGMSRSCRLDGRCVDPTCPLSGVCRPAPSRARARRPARRRRASRAPSARR